MLLMAFVRSVRLERLGRTFPFGLKSIPPICKNFVEFFSFKPDVAQGLRIVLITMKLSLIRTWDFEVVWIILFTTLESKSDQSDAIFYIEMKHAAPVIEFLITRRPRQIFRIEAVVELRVREAKKPLVFLVRGVTSIVLGVGDFARIRF